MQNFSDQFEQQIGHELGRFGGKTGEISLFRCVLIICCLGKGHGRVQKGHEEVDGRPEGNDQER